MIDWSLKLETAPTSEPVTISEVKDHLRVDTGDDDTDLGRKIAAARQWVEEFTGRSLMVTTWKLYLSDWPVAIQLPNPPMKTLTSILYLDTGGTEQTLGTEVYITNSVAEPAVIREAYSKSWPALRNRQYNSITVEYIAGYASASAVPQAIRQALILRVQAAYDDPAANELNDAAAKLLWPYRTFQEVPWL